MIRIPVNEDLELIIDEMRLSKARHYYHNKRTGETFGKRVSPVYYEPDGRLSIRSHDKKYYFKPSE